MDKYLKRCVDEILKEKLESSGAVLIKGPKWCGKSTTAKQFTKSAIYMQKSGEREQNIALAKNAPNIFLSGKTPKLIDEWQIIPFIWDDIRYEIDERNKFGQFILTGSSTPLLKNKNEISHSGIGRITTLVMRPMSLYESLDSSGTVSLNDLFNGFSVTGGKSSKTLADYAFLTCRGGWPSSVGVSEKVGLNIAKNYYDSLVEIDLSEADEVNRDLDKVKATLRSYARNVSTECSIQTLIKDIKENDNKSISDETIRSYITALKNIYILEDISAWNPNLRSRTIVRTSPTRHFVDPSIGCIALGIGPKDLINDLKTFGLFFEDLVVRDLKIYSEKLGGKVYHYRDNAGLETDAVIHLENGKWGAIEIKLCDSDRIEEGVNHLLKFSKLISKNRKEPSFLMVVTATEYAYKRKDGVWIVPLACLKD